MINFLKNSLLAACMLGILAFYALLVGLLLTPIWYLPIHYPLQCLAVAGAFMASGVIANIILKLGAKK